jgi:hypothetical protein
MIPRSLHSWMDFFPNVLYSTLLHLPPSDSTVSEDAGIEPRTVATSALAVRRSNHSAKSNPHAFLILNNS